MVAFGWVYPHFLDGPAIDYLYAAPVGLVPVSHPGRGERLRSPREWSGIPGRALTLAAVALSYGLFGVLRLGVFLDIPLAIGVIALVVAELHALKGGGVNADTTAARSGLRTHARYRWQARP